MTAVFIVTEEMVTAGLRAWFGEDGPFFTAAKSIQRDYMRQALVAALSAPPASPAGGQSQALDEPESQALSPLLEVNQGLSASVANSGGTASPKSDSPKPACRGCGTTSHIERNGLCFYCYGASVAKSDSDGGH
jgi:hypothetical protein